MAVEDATMDEGLRHLRRLRRWLLGLFLGFLPALVLAVALQPPSWVLTSVAVLWFVAFVVVAMIHAFYRCPRCHRFFHVRGMFGNWFASKCMNCGLELSRLEPERKGNQ